MSFSAGFSSAGFSVVADNALDYIAGAEAAGAGYVGANIQAMSSTLHQDSQQLMGVVAEKSGEIMAVNQAGFAQVDTTMRRGFSNLKTLSGVQIAIQAAGFAIVAGQLQGVRRDLRHLAAQGEMLVGLQRIANQRLDQLVDIAQRSVEVQERILDALLTSRTVEAQQLLRQGWDNLKHGYEDEALSRFEQSLHHDNTVYVAHAYLARLYRKRGDRTRAEDHYVRAARFSTGVNTEVHALACLEYATFLENEDRFADCIAQLRYVLQHSDKPTWRFHLAELLARIGVFDEALAELRLAIESDDELFAASMVSQDLAGGLGPRLIHLLADLDELRRSSGFGHIQAVCQDLERIGLIATLESPIAIVQRQIVDDLREQAAAILRDHLGATYAELPSPTRRAYELRGRVAREADAAPHRPAAALQTWVAAWNQSIRRYLAAHPPLGPDPWSASDVLGVLLTVGGVITLIIGLHGWSDHGWDPSWLVVYEIGGPLSVGVVAIAVGIVLILSRRSAKRAQVAAHVAARRTRQATTDAVADLFSEVMSTARLVAARWAVVAPHPVLIDLDARLAALQVTARPTPQLNAAVGGR